jgi:hypothetical protein
MKKICALAVAVCVMLSAGVAFSQDWATVSKTLKDNCSKFTGGIKDLTMTMEMKNTSPRGATSSTSTLYRKGDKFRSEITLKELPGGAAMPPEMAGMKTVVIDDGTNLWMISPMTGKMQMPATDLEQYRGQWLCSDYIPQKGEVIGSETIDGRDCWVIADEDANAPVTRLWIDKKSYNLLKLMGKAEAGQPTMTATFSDFRTVANDFEIPFVTKVSVGPDMGATITVTSAAANTGLSEDLFDAGKIEGKPGDMMDLMKKMREQQRDTN